MQATTVAATDVEHATTCSRANGGARNWQDEWSSVRDIASRLKSATGCEEDSWDLIKALLRMLDMDDALLAFVAMQTLHDALRVRAVDEKTANRCIRILVTPDLPLAAGTRRFQLLRQLLKAATASQNDTANDHSEAESSSSGGEVDDDDDSEDQPAADHEWLLIGVLENVHTLQDLIMAAISSGHAMDSSTVAHEAIVLLVAIVKRVPGRHVDAFQPDSLEKLCHLVKSVVHQIATRRFDGDNPSPAFLACDLIDLLVNARDLFGAIHPCSEWLTTVLEAVALPASISTLALALVNDETSSWDTRCAESFISPKRTYPLLQKWIQLCCLVAMEALTSANTHVLELIDTNTDSDNGISSWITKLPTRSRLMAILIEQDDTMIDVLLHLLGISRRCEDLHDQHGSFPTQWMTYIREELAADLLFADLLQGFRDDHLVLLDMLVSSETRMLDYTMQYLKHAILSWPRCREAWQRIDRCALVMAVLIRLRLEMERLVDAGVFPYNPGPLLRRLDQIEKLYEGDEESET